MQRFLRTAPLFLLMMPFVFAQSARERNPATEWRTYNHDLAGTRFSPLSQINTTNVAHLTPFTQNVAFIGWMQKMPAGWVDPVTRERSTVPFDRGSEAGRGPYQQFTARATGPDGRSVQGGSWPCQKPPWGQLSAVNANTAQLPGRSRSA